MPDSEWHRIVLIECFRLNHFLYIFIHSINFESDIFNKFYIYNRTFRNTCDSISFAMKVDTYM